MKLENLNFFEQQVEELILEIKSHYGYDFSGYSRASVYRRINRFLTLNHLSEVEELKKKVLSDPFYFERFLQQITVNVTEMFRDPGFFLSLRKKVLPILSTYPYIKIWDAGCSTGEELFSLTILLQEEGLLDRTRIYATDINQKVLKQAREGIFPATHLAADSSAYLASGGKKAYSNYYVSHYGSLKFNASLIRNVVFYPHNLATDFSFNEFHLILCRNVLIYFTSQLQEKVLNLFDQSLVGLGYLGLGKKESLSMSGVGIHFNFVDKENRIYRKIS